MGREPPQFAEGSRLLEEAYRFACQAHEGHRSEGDTGIDHPARVAELLADRGFDADVLAAALLHDTVEDTGVELDEVECRFGSRVGELVGAMTEDESFEPYERRKAEHRARVAAAGRAVSAIYAADKVAKLHEARENADELPPAKLAHYAATLRELRAAYPDLPFLDQLERELPSAQERAVAPPR